MQNSGGTSLRIGQRLGRYRIEALLGMGGMAAVYRAHDRMLQRTVAIKVPNRTDADAWRSLLQEARLAALLSHPAICRIHAVGSDGHRPFIVMEHVIGVPISMVMQSERLPVPAALGYITQIVQAVAHAHTRHVVHCDLKSSNILIGPDGSVKIVDFGIAVRQSTDEDTRSMDLETTRSCGSSGAGTIPYMAPEVLSGRRADWRSDVWALGVLMYEIFSGDRPFKGATRYEIAAAILGHAPAPLPARVPADLRLVVARCLEKEPDNRYRSGCEVATAIGLLPG